MIQYKARVNKQLDTLNTTEQIRNANENINRWTEVVNTRLVGNIVVRSPNLSWCGDHHLWYSKVCDDNSLLWSTTLSGRHAEQCWCVLCCVEVCHTILAVMCWGTLGIAEEPFAVLWWGKMCCGEVRCAVLCCFEVSGTSLCNAEVG